MKIERCDVLVIGGGGAGLRAAIEADTCGANVILLTKGKLGASGVTATACSDRMAFHVTLPHTEPGGPENWKYHADDIYAIGGYVSDYDLAEVLARESAEAFYFLDALGVPFVKKGKRPDQFVTDGSKYARACYTGPRTANDIEAALVRRLSDTTVRVLQQAMAAQLILDDHGRSVLGALCIDAGSQQFFGVEARTTILATGGAGCAFQVHVYPEGMTGDGYSLAYRAGAELVNMEFIQIGLSSVRTKLACSGSLMRAIPRFLDSDGVEFLAKHFPCETNPMEIHSTVFRKGASWPVSQREPSRIIDIAVSREMASGKRAFLDFRSDPKGFDFEAFPPDIKESYDKERKTPEKNLPKKTPLQRLREINPESIAWLKEHGVDLEAGELLEVAPAAQHFQGGVKINRRAETSLRNLYAAGECAGGQHGANRPGGNALLDSQVFGKIAGRNAAERASASVGQGVTERMLERSQKSLEATLTNPAARPALQVRQAAQALLSSAAGVIRTQQDLSDALAQLGKLSGCGLKLDGNGLAYAVETLAILDTATMVMGAALRREESRGPHLFFDSPDSPEPLPIDEQNWRHYTVVVRREGEPVFEKRDPVPGPGG